VEEFGTCDIAGEEFLGVYQTPAMGQRLLGSVTETLDARSQYNLPENCIVLMFDGMGGLIVLDASRKGDSGEYPVSAWDPGKIGSSDLEPLGDNFGIFALDLCQKAVNRWRESSN
jgi:hypothetical protein